MVRASLASLRCLQWSARRIGPKGEARGCDAWRLRTAHSPATPWTTERGNVVRQVMLSASFHCCTSLGALRARGIQTNCSRSHLTSNLTCAQAIGCRALERRRQDSTIDSNVDQDYCVFCSIPFLFKALRSIWIQVPRTCQLILPTCKYLRMLTAPCRGHGGTGKWPSGL